MNSDYKNDTFVSFLTSDEKSCYINIDSYENRQLKGTIFNPYYNCSKQFQSLTELLFLMEQLFDELFIPEGKQDIRTFGGIISMKKLWSSRSDVAPKKKGKLATFNISVLFRRRASWQGQVVWLETMEEECFRSVFELIQLMDSALAPDGFNGDIDNSENVPVNSDSIAGIPNFAVNIANNVVNCTNNVKD